MLGSKVTKKYLFNYVEFPEKFAEEIERPKGNARKFAPFVQ